VCHIPQGSVLGLLEFIDFKEDVVSIPVQTPLDLHQYADDMELYMFPKPADISSVCSTFSGWINNIKTWCSSCCLQLNAEKNGADIFWLADESGLPECDVCDVRLTFEHLLLSCCKYNLVGRKFFNLNSLQELFPRVKPHVIVAYAKEIGFDHKV
jgi:hypothetical protein